MDIVAPTETTISTGTTPDNVPTPLGTDSATTPTPSSPVQPTLDDDASQSLNKAIFNKFVLYP